MGHQQQPTDRFPLPEYLKDEPRFDLKYEPEVMVEEELPITIVPRLAWGARPNQRPVPMHFPILKVKFSYEDVYKTDDYLTKALRKTQDYYMDELKLPDVPYNFLVDEGGLIYEGRGWEVSPDCAGDRGGPILNIAFIGDYRIKGDRLNPPSFNKCDAANSLIMQGVRAEKIVPNYQVMSMHSRNQVKPDTMKWFPTD